MANTYQAASFRRKLIYFGTIVVLFGVTIAVRGIGKEPAKGTIRQQSNELQLNEMSQGDVELTGSAIRLLLTGSRGLAICALWMSAKDHQMRQEWSKLEDNVNDITMIQPHFVTPWLFQSWNLTYNVSVEMDNLSDMYFYIARGIKLLAKGETVNGNNPEIRYAIAFYYQNKFEVSDKVTTLRCLLQLSCLPKKDRDYRKLIKDDKSPDMEGGFKDFCEKHPALVRRLRETEIQYGRNSQGQFLKMYLAPKPSDVVNFLKENENLPSRYVEGTAEDKPELESRLEQFPVLPPQTFNDKEEDEMKTNGDIGDSYATGTRAARAWFRYANEVIPPPTGVPGPTPTNYRDPEGKRRVPKQPMLIIFRQGRPRAQCYIAENLAKEGWIDSDPWVVDSESRVRWFKQEVVAKRTSNSKEEWEIANTMWRKHGVENGFMLAGSRERLDLEQKRAELAKVYGLPKEQMIPLKILEDERDPDRMKLAEAAKELLFNGINLQVTNFETWYYKTILEMDPKTIGARKLLFQAELAQKSGFTKRALKLYESAFGSQQKPGPWADVLRMRRDNEDPGKGDQFLEETYEMQVRYMNLVKVDKEAELRRATLLLFDVARTASPARHEPAYLLTGNLILNLRAGVLAQVEPVPPPGPYDGLNSEGKEWIPETVKERVRQQLEQNKGGPKKAPAPPPSTGQASAGGS